MECFNWLIFTFHFCAFRMRTLRMENSQLQWELWAECWGKTRQTSFLAGSSRHIIFYEHDPQGQQTTPFFSFESKFSADFFSGNVWHLFDICVWSTWISSTKIYQVGKLLAFILPMRSVEIFTAIHNMPFSLARSYRRATATSKFGVNAIARIRNNWAAGSLIPGCT